jgi:hypothetical protein
VTMIPQDRNGGPFFGASAWGLGLLALALAACAGPGGNPDTADTAQCDQGFLCGSYVDGDGDRNVSQTEWDNAFRQADTNGDGQLSQGEFQAGGGNWGGGRGGR